MKRLIISSYIILLSAATFAQETLTLKDAVQIGLENGYSIRLSKNDAKIAANNNTYGNAGFLPKIDATAGANLRASHDKMTALDGVKSTNTPNTSNLNTGISLSWTLFDGMNMFISKEKFDLYQQLGETNLQASLEETASQIIAIYNAIVQQKKLIKVHEEVLAISKTRVDIAQKANNIGSGSEVTLLKAQVDYKTDSSNVVQHQLALSNLKAEMNNQLGRDPQVAFDVADAELIPSTLSLLVLMQNALKQNSALIASRQQLSISELEVKGAKATQLPNLNLNSSYTMNQYNYKNGSYDKTFSHGPYVGITAGITLFNGFNVRRNIKNAQIQLENSQIQNEQLEQRLKTDIIKTFNTYTTNCALTDIEKKSLALAQLNLDIALKAYAQGSISDIEMRETQRNYIDVSYRLMQAQVNLKNTEVELKRISGTLLIKETPKAAQ